MSIKSKKLISIAVAATLLGASGASFAAMAPDFGKYQQDQMDYSGFNISGQFGYSTQEVNEVISGQDGIGGRLAVGYDFNRYFGLELGGTRYNDIDFVSRYYNSFAISFDTIQTYAIDLLAKGTLPLAHSNVNLFLKAGVAEVFQHFRGSTDSSTRPKVAIGFGYRATPNIGFNFTLARIFNTRFGSTDLDSFFAGVTYHFI